MPHLRKLLVCSAALLLPPAGCATPPVDATDGSTSSSAESADSSTSQSSSSEATTASVDTSEGSSETSSSSEGSSTGPATLPPNAVDDVYVVLMNGETLDVAAVDGLLVNDADDDGGVLSVVADAGVVSEAGALVELDADGGFRYTPATDVWGEDAFVYELLDGQGGSAQGHVRVLVRPTAIPLSRVADGFGGFTIDGTEINGEAGWSMDGLGDVDGDGLGDVVIGARGVELQVGPQTGRCYVVFGKADTATVDLSQIAAGDGGFAIDGEAAWDLACSSVRGAGDVDGDGLADVVVGAPIHDANEFVARGRAYVVFGKQDGGLVALTDVAAGLGGFAIDAAFDDATTGISVDGGGDVNGDGLTDLLVGSSLSEHTGSPPGSFVVFGKVGGDAVSLAEVAQGQGGFAIHAEDASDGAGGYLAMAGDVDGDGLADLLIGASAADPNGNLSGRGYLVFGKADTDAVMLSQVAAGVGGFAIDGSAEEDYVGRVLAGGGDVNGDGLDDLLLGVPDSDAAAGEGSGRSYVVFGKADGELVTLTDVAAGLGGFVLDGANINDYSGTSVAGVGDLDGDGLDDVFVGAWLADPHGQASGRSYLVFGKADGEAVMLAQVAEGVGGFAIDGAAAYDTAGHAVAGAGDVDGDGIVDLLIGADSIDLDGVVDAGRSYVVLGRDLVPMR